MGPLIEDTSDPAALGHAPLCADCGKLRGPSVHPVIFPGLGGEQIRDLCFDCAFWHEKRVLAESGAALCVRISGTHYIVGKEDAPRGCKGFDGREFVIKMHDGRRIVTTNLWHQGRIPDRFRDLLPNNAEWGE